MSNFTKNHVDVVSNFWDLHRYMIPHRKSLTSAGNKLNLFRFVNHANGYLCITITYVCVIDRQTLSYHQQTQPDLIREPCQWILVYHLRLYHR